MSDEIREQIAWVRDCCSEPSNVATANKIADTMEKLLAENERLEAVNVGRLNMVSDRDGVIERLSAENETAMGALFWIVTHDATSNRNMVRNTLTALGKIAAAQKGKSDG